MEEIARAHSQQLEEERKTPVSGANTFSDFLASDCVETVDMATHSDPQARLGLSADLLMGAEVSSTALPPPDMFDDVHYMHSGSVDDTHVSDLEENEELVDDVSTFPQVTPRSVSRFTTFGTPRSKAGVGKPTPRRGTLSSEEEHNPYLPMQPVIVDSRSASTEEAHSRPTVDSQVLGEHFDGGHSFRPTRGQSPSHKAPMASPEKLSPKSHQPNCDNSPTSEVPKDPLRPVPARRRLLENAEPGGRSASPRSATPHQIHVKSSQPEEARGSEVTIPGESGLTSPRSEMPMSSRRTSPSGHSPKSSPASEMTHPHPAVPASTPSPPAVPSTSPLTLAVRKDAVTPRYAPPPSYSSAVGHKQGGPNSSKSVPSPVYSTGNPSRSSPVAASSSQRPSVDQRTQVMKGGVNRADLSLPLDQGQSYRTADTSVAASLDRHSSPHHTRESPTSADQISYMYSSRESSQDSLNSLRPREGVMNGAPYRPSRTPRERTVSPVRVREPFTPRERSSSRPAPRSHTTVHGTIATPRDSLSPYTKGKESPPDFVHARQASTKNSRDSVMKSVDSVLSPRNHMVGTPRTVQLNGMAGHTPYNSMSGNGFHSHGTVKVQSPLSPRDSVSMWPQPQQSRGSLNSSTTVIADVHQPGDRGMGHTDTRHVSRPGSGTFDASTYSEQTVTFV